MKNRRKLEITVETNQRFIIRRADNATPVWCPECTGQLVTQEEAVTIAGISSRMLHRWAEAGKVHSSETIEGFLLVCLNSLSELGGPDDL